MEVVLKVNNKLRLEICVNFLLEIVSDEMISYHRNLPICEMEIVFDCIR